MVNRRITPAATTQSKNGMGRIGYLLPGGTIGVSGYIGHNPAEAPGQNVKFNFIAADLEEKYGPFTLVSEGMRGSNGSTKPEGFYATLAFQGAGKATQPYLRFDNYTPDKDFVPLASQLGNHYHRTTAGINYFLSPTSKFQLEYQAIDDEANPRYKGQVVTEYQVVF